jgi:uncharacterized membrane protein YedE/YeeE
MKATTLAALSSGALFGAGLAMSGMTDARRVLGFLDVAGDFDPALLFVLGGAVATTALLFRFVLRRGSPILASTFHISSFKHVDRPLLGGAALFGIGWGLAGAPGLPSRDWAFGPPKRSGSCRQCWVAFCCTGSSIVPDFAVCSRRH